jgi:putative SOS response-associated peptidase YedK
MCGRFVQRYIWDDVQDLYELSDGPARNRQAHYNVSPTDPVGVVRYAANGATELVSMRWQRAAITSGRKGRTAGSRISVEGIWRPSRSSFRRRLGVRRVRGAGD